MFIFLLRGTDEKITASPVTEKSEEERMEGRDRIGKRYGERGRRRRDRKEGKVTQINPSYTQRSRNTNSCHKYHLHSISLYYIHDEDKK